MVRRRLLIALCVVWAAMILACTGAGGKWFDLPGEHSITRSDNWDYYFALGPVEQIRGHITHVGFDDRFILLRRDVCKRIDESRRRRHELTGVIEYYIVEVSPRAPGGRLTQADFAAEAKRTHGPFTEAEFAAARERLGVPAELALEPTDAVRSRVGPPRE